MSRALIMLALLAAAGPARATDAFDPEAVTVYKTSRWERTERLVDSHPKMIQERFIPLVEHKVPEIVAAFAGDASPRSSQVLLHYATGWNTARESVPVILVPGAGVTANHCYADRPFEQPFPGLAACLAKAGRAVFAVTFAHPHGDNRLQAEALACAISRVRIVTGASKVDLVAHSKGGMAARLYLSDAGPKWSTRYRRDVRRYVMLGTPNGGIDVAFAFPNLNYWVLEHKSPAPLSWTEALYYGKWVSFADRTLYRGGPFPGQAQMVARWDGRYGRTRAKGQYDVDATYDGGRGTVSVSLGIDAAITGGGDMIARLGKRGIHPSVELAALAGTNPWVMNLIGERRGPNDGLLLVASALDLASLTRRGAKVIRRSLRHFNHLQLLYDPRANTWVREVLEQ